MSDSNNGFGGGILKGLKRILFTDEDGAPQQAPDATPPTQGTIAAQPTEIKNNIVAAWPSADESNKEMKVKVYQLLENMNQPGIDFFEVWNASTEMGGSSAANIKAAFTSLRFADKSLIKGKLLESGTYYMTNLQNVLKTETQKRLDEKPALRKKRNRWPEASQRKLPL